MNPIRTCWKIPLLFVVAAALSFVCHASIRPAGEVVLWDTIESQPPGKTNDPENWREVPSDLFALEANPAKSSSDPGYYGRNYNFKGDAAAKNEFWTLLFSRQDGKAHLYQNGKGTKDHPELGEEIGTIEPSSKKNGAISHFELVRNAGDEIVLKVTFAGFDSPAVVHLGRSATIEINTPDEMKGLRVVAPIEYAVVPGFVSDDLLFKANDEVEAQYLPVENMLVALLKGETSELVMTWPGKQEVKMQSAEGRGGKAVEFGKSGTVYLSTIHAKGVWHREILGAKYLEQDVKSQWQRPFPAHWQSELNESGVTTRFAFRDSKQEIWRGVPGNYEYPVWFDGDAAMFHFSKKVPPKGEAIIYFLEADGTPLSVSTPVDYLTETLGRASAGAILDYEGRKLRTHHRRDATGVRRACTCGCTEAIQAVFEAGDETGQQEYIEGALGDMIFFIQEHLKRIDEYRQFADETAKLLKARAESSTDLKPFADAMQEIVGQIPSEYQAQLENIKDLKYAAELKKQTMELTHKKESGNLAAYMELLKAWRGMGGAQDYIVAQCHMITRNLFQEAGYQGSSQPQTVELAREIRQRCRAVLRNADGYEVWPNY